MSMWVSLEVHHNPCNECYGEEGRRCHECHGSRKTESEVFSRNVTRNVSPMLVKSGAYEVLNANAYEDGVKASDIIAKLEAAVRDMEGNFQEYEKLNPPNGWGSAEGTLKFLRATLEACKDYPEAQLGVST